jgi:uncharacterized protein YuzB (UPF0349 family)
MSIEHEFCVIALSATPHLHVMEWPSLAHYVGCVVELFALTGLSYTLPNITAKA